MANPSDNPQKKIIACLDTIIQQYAAIDRQQRTIPSQKATIDCSSPPIKVAIFDGGMRAQHYYLDGTPYTIIIQRSDMT